MLGGGVSAASEAGHGSRFSLTLPAVFLAPVESVHDAEPEAEIGEEAPDLVLVIDDEPDYRSLMTRFLRKEGFRVQLAADGRTGLELARKLRPRAILLDVMMPGIDGWSVLSALKADPNLADIPVVMVTGFDQRGLASALGASDYILKPVEWDRLGKIMNRFRTPEGGILIVEDDAAARERIRSLLEKDGWIVVEAGNGREGLERLTERRPEVVLLDLNMPVMDGFDFLVAFRALRGCAGHSRRRTHRPRSDARGSSTSARRQPDTQQG